MSSLKDMRKRLDELQKLQDELLKQQAAALENVRETTEAVQKAKAVYDEAETDRKEKGETVDLHQAKIRQMADEFQTAAEEERIYVESSRIAAEAEGKVLKNERREEAEQKPVEEEQGIEKNETGSIIDKNNSFSHEIVKTRPAGSLKLMQMPIDNQVSIDENDTKTQQSTKNRSAASHTYDLGYKKWEQLDVDALLREQEEEDRAAEEHETITAKVQSSKQRQKKNLISTKTVDKDAQKVSREPRKEKNVKETWAQSMPHRCKCVLNIVEGENEAVKNKDDDSQVACTLLQYVLERHNNIGQYVVYLRYNSSTEELVDEVSMAEENSAMFLVGDEHSNNSNNCGHVTASDWQPTIGFRNECHDIVVQFRDTIHTKSTHVYNSDLAAASEKWDGAEVRMHFRKKVDPSQCTLTVTPDRCCIVLKLKWAKHSVEDALLHTDFGDSRPAKVDGGVHAATRAWKAGNVHCRFCGQALVKPATVHEVLPLPSANWGEMMDMLLCHGHDNTVDASTVEAGEAGEEAGGFIGMLLSLSDNLTAKAKKCLVGPTYLLLQRSDLRRTAVGVDRKTTLEGGCVVQCKRCCIPLGVATQSDDTPEAAEQRRLRRLQRCNCIIPATAHRQTIFATPPPPVPVGRGRKLFSSSQKQQTRSKKPRLTEIKLNKFRLTMYDTDSNHNNHDLLGAYDAESHVGAQVLALAENAGCFRIVLCSIVDGSARLKITASNFTTQLQTRNMVMRRVLRVEYEECYTDKSTISKESDSAINNWLVRFDGRKLHLHEDELDEVLSALKHNNQLLPVPYNVFQGKKVSFLRW